MKLVYDETSSNVKQIIYLTKYTPKNYKYEN